MSNTPPVELRVEHAGQTLLLTRRGPGMRGWIYATDSPVCFYRVLELKDAPLAVRHEYSDGKGGTPPQAAAIVDTWQEAGRFYVEYGAGKSSETLADILLPADDGRQTDLGRSLRCVAEVASALAAWWAAMSPPVLATPFDIVLGPADRPLLLWMPGHRVPDTEELLAASARGLWLAPELVRGQSVRDPRALDVFVLAATISLCVVEPPSSMTPENALRMAAAGGVLLSGRPRRDLPYWLRRTTTRDEILAVGRSLMRLSPKRRMNVDIVEVARNLRSLSESIDPVKSATQVKNSGNPEDAYLILQETLLPVEPPNAHEVLLLAGDIAGRHMGRALDAADLYERAIAMGRPNTEAYEKQLHTITTARSSPELQALMQDPDDRRLKRLDQMVSRDFTALQPSRQAEKELLVAKFLLWRRRNQEAADFIYERLFDAQGNYMWYKFDLAHAYAEALLALGELGRARAQIETLKGSIRKGHANGVLDDESRDARLKAAAALESRIGPSPVGGARMAV